MRIGINFHTLNRYISGVEYYTLGMINAFLSIDKHNDYLVLTNRPDIVEQHVHPSENLTIREIGHLKSRLSRIIWEHTRLPYLVVRERLDVLHCPNYICPLHKAAVPYVVTVHDTIAIDHPKWCKLSNVLYFNLFMKAALKRASSIIAVSKCAANDIRRNFSLPSSKIRVVYPGIDAIFKPEGKASHLSDVKTRYNLPERYILYVGNIEPKKNIRTLLRVYETLKKKLPHKLVLVGKRSWMAKAELDEIFREAALNNIVLAGYVDRNDLPFVYQMADAFVFLSLYEGFGFPPLEAMACGTPVVSSQRGALGETVSDAALTVDPDNVNEIVNVIFSIISDSSLREKHVRMGIMQSSLFSWRETAAQLLEIYSKIAGKT